MPTAPLAVRPRAAAAVLSRSFTEICPVAVVAARGSGGAGFRIGTGFGARRGSGPTPTTLGSRAFGRAGACAKARQGLAGAAGKGRRGRAKGPCADRGAGPSSPPTKNGGVPAGTRTPAAGTTSAAAVRPPVSRSVATPREGVTRGRRARTTAGPATSRASTLRAGQRCRRAGRKVAPEAPITRRPGGRRSRRNGRSPEAALASGRARSGTAAS